MTSLYDIFLKHPSVSTDSRNIAPGSIFFALKGESFNGNLYAQAALEKGAAYAVVDQHDVVGGAYARQMVLVDDVLQTLQSLAAFHRKRLGIPVLAITGSNGKTTTKELVARVLACRYNVAVTRGNLNNHIGVPLTLLSIGRDAEFAIVEMGASSRYEIELLSNIAQPDFGIITNIGRAHLEGFGGEQGVIAGKGELFDYLSQHNGLAFHLQDDESLSSMVAQRTNLRSQSYCAELATGLKSNLVGDYNRFNIAAAVAIGSYFEVEHHRITDAIASYRPDNNRSQRLTTTHNELIMDCYNANPSSMAVAIDNLAQESVLAPNGQEVYTKAAILGDMLELGEYSATEHTAILERALQAGINEIYLVGRCFAAAAETLTATPTESASGNTQPKICTYATTTELSQHLAANPIANRLILIKGSHSISLELLREVL